MVFGSHFRESGLLGMPFDSQCVTDSVGCWNVAFLASVIFCGGGYVPADGALGYSTFALICGFVDHYFGSVGGERISVEVVVPEEAGVG